MLDLKDFKDHLTNEFKHHQMTISFLSPLETYGLLLQTLARKRKKKQFLKFLSKIDFFLGSNFFLNEQEKSDLYTFFTRPHRFTADLVSDPTLIRTLQAGKLLEKGAKRAQYKINHPFLSERDVNAVRIFYRPVRIPKKKGGYRILQIPGENLKSLQKKILQSFYQMHISFPCAHGFHPGKSAYTNASVHKDAKKLLGMDIKDAFGSIDVRKALKPQLLKLLGSYGTDFVLKYSTCPNQHTRGLPQGAPTSGYLLNLALFSFDAYISAVCHSLGLHYSRFADDICISATKENITSFSTRGMINLVEDQLNTLGFRINRKKVHIHSHRISATGYVLNSGRATIPKKERRIYRAMLFNHKSKKQSLTPGKIAGIIGWITTAHPKYAQKLVAKYL